MTENSTEVEETFETNEQGVAYSSESAPAADAPVNSTIAPAAATGRRKQAVARVRVRTGTGKVTVNKRALEEYFPSAMQCTLATEPLRLTNTTEVYDVDATMDGGGMAGQAGALRLGIARALAELDPELRDSL